MEDDWIFLGDGGAGGGDTDSASDAGSDSGFTIVSRGRNQCSTVARDDAPVPPRVADVAVPHPTPPGLSFKVVSYAEAFSPSASSSSEDDGGGREQPGCIDDEAIAAGEAIVQGAGIDDAATDEEDEDTFSSGDDEDEDTFGSSDEEDEDTFGSSDEDHTEIFSEEEYTAEIYSEEEDDDNDDDDAESFGEEDGSESSGEMDYVEIHSEEEDDDSECSDNVDDVESTGEEEDAVDLEISGEDEEGSDAECSGEEDDRESSGSGSDMNTDSSGSGSDMDTDSSDMEDNDCFEPGEEADIVDVAENGNQDIFAMLFPKAKACGANMNDCEDEADILAQSGNQDIFAMLLPKDKSIENGNQDIFAMLLPKDKSAENVNQDIFAMLLPKDKSAENGNQDIFAMLFPKAKACGANMNDCQDEADVAQNGNQAIFAMLFPKAKACGANINNRDQDDSEHGNIDDYEEEEDGSLFDMLLPKDHAIDDDIDTDSSRMEDNCLESDGNGNLTENGNQDRAPTACDANVDDYEAESEHGCIDDEEELEVGSWFDMLFPGDRDIDDDIDTDRSGMEDNCLESDENGDQDISAMLRAMAANIDDYDDESEHGSIDYEEEELEDGSWFDMLFPHCAIDEDVYSSDGEDEAATDATAACGDSAEPHGTRRPEFAGRASRGYDDIDTDSDMEMGDDNVVAADVINGTSLESQHWATMTQRQALSEDLRRQFAAEASQSSRQQQQQRSYDNVDDTCDVPGTAAPGGGAEPAGSCACAQTPDAKFTARAVRDAERELAMEEARRREAALRELDRALARQAAPAAQALEATLQGCRPTVKRQATGVTQAAVARLDVPADITFIFGVYVFVFFVVCLLSLGMS